MSEHFLEAESGNSDDETDDNQECYRKSGDSEKT